MELLDAIRTRRSIRKYEVGKDVSKETIQKILELALNAPSAGNRQPWRLHVVKNQLTKKALCEAAFGQKFLEEAPWVICVVAVPEESAARYGDRGRNLYCIQDTAALVTYIMLIAREFNLDTCWVGAFDENRANEILDLPAGQRCVAMIPIGYAAEPRKDRPRRSLGEIVVFHE
ncbi:nitroreductase family protein [Pseudothermotoga sp.]|nr:nitroreductase family protein [Pseudothermotoga sp.]MCX7812773.1 nitroreductase family protein [Pseudothermotoga sp.]MDW8139053.1 nitroreductase family protein [Pseudothermotoga sp.]